MGAQPHSHDPHFTENSDACPLVIRGVQISLPCMDEKEQPLLEFILSGSNPHMEGLRNQIIYISVGCLMSSN
jgi:hypothetical protein